jgi:hypothetical protein
MEMVLHDWALYQAATPRAVKQYKNMLRYLAMRLRSFQETGDADTSIPEPELVALGAIGLTSRDLLNAATPPHGKPIQVLIKDAIATAQSDNQAVYEKIAIALDKRVGTVNQVGGVTSLESWIPQYLALLPPAV